MNVTQLGGEGIRHGPTAGWPQVCVLYCVLPEAEVLSSICIQRHDIQERHLVASLLIHEWRKLSLCLPELLRLDEDVPGLRGRLGMFSSPQCSWLVLWSVQKQKGVMGFQWKLTIKYQRTVRSLEKETSQKIVLKFFRQSLLFQEILFLSCLDTWSVWKQLTCREKSRQQNAACCFQPNSCHSCQKALY